MEGDPAQGQGAQGRLRAVRAVPAKWGPRQHCLRQGLDSKGHGKGGGRGLSSPPKTSMPALRKVIIAEAKLGEDSPSLV